MSVRTSRNTRVYLPFGAVLALVPVIAIGWAIIAAVWLIIVVTRVLIFLAGELIAFLAGGLTAGMDLISQHRNPI